MRVVFISFFIFISSFSFAVSNEEGHISQQEELDVKEIIFSHIVNDYSWHIFTTPGGKHVTIPLPVILYSENSGFHVFMSSKFNHGHATYKNFKIAEEGFNAGRIVEVNANGDVVEGTLIDLSITKVVVGLFVGVIVLLLIFLSAAKVASRNPKSAPKGILSFVEPLILFVRDDIAKAVIGKHYNRFMPYLLTIFFFILISNVFGLIPFPPFGANVTGNISVTATLALFTFIVTTVNGNKGYWKHIFNAPGVPWWLKLPVPLMPIVELIGVFTKPIILAIRLFANMSAGHIVVLAFITLIFVFGSISGSAGLGASPFTVLFAIFIFVLDLLVAFIQAFVFTLLSAIYFGMAVEEHH
jgi:F-type H+-transporting ATPase subunit a